MIRLTGIFGEEVRDLTILNNGQSNHAKLNKNVLLTQQTQPPTKWNWDLPQVMEQCNKKRKTKFQNFCLILKKTNKNKKTKNKNC
jgi:hypothetical protein